MEWHCFFLQSWNNIFCHVGAHHEFVYRLLLLLLGKVEIINPVESLQRGVYNGGINGMYGVELKH